MDEQKKKYGLQENAPKQKKKPEFGKKSMLTKKYLLPLDIPLMTGTWRYCFPHSEKKKRFS